MAEYAIDSLKNSICCIFEYTDELAEKIRNAEDLAKKVVYLR